MKNITLFVNNEVVYDFDREITIDDEQLAFLDRMDSDMDKGIKIKGELINNPDSQQRAIFIVLNLIVALQQNNNSSISAASAYLAHRYPTLLEAHANDDNDTINIELVND